MNQSSARVLRIRIVVCGVVFFAVSCFAQTEPREAGVVYEVYHDTSLPLSELYPAAVHSPIEPQQPQQTLSGSDVPLPATPGSVQVGTTSVLAFDGLAATGWSSPDTNGSAGATQFVQWVNTKFAVYNKATGAKIFGPIQGSSLFGGFGGLCQTSNGGDIIAQYDKAAARWVMTQRALQSGGPFLQCVAVSTTSDATGAWYRYAFTLTNNYPDYPKLGVWSDGYYISINQMNPTTFQFIGGLVCALDRNKMLTGAAATAQCVSMSTTAFSLLPADLDGATPPPAGSPNYFVALGPSGLNLWKYHVDFQHPANSNLTGPVQIKVNGYTQACNGGFCIPQPGTTQKLDSLGDRLMYRLAYRNFGDHESLVVTHSITTQFNSAGLRWYEIRKPGGNPPTIFQQGTFAPDASNRWLGSIAMDKVGDIAIGYSVSSSTIYPSIRYTGRVPTDPLGSLEGEAAVIAGTGVQTGTNNWGDYSSMSVDPVDDCTFWYTNEYYKSTGNGTWKTRIAAFKFPSCH